MSSPTKQTVAPDLTLVATQIIFYRSPECRDFVSPLATDERARLADSVLLYFDPSLARKEYPLRFHIILTCIVANPFRWTQFHKNGPTLGGRGSQIVDWPQLLESLLSAFANFPRGFVTYPFDSKEAAAATPNSANLAKEQIN